MGARPGDLPVQAAARFDFVVNLAAARAIGLTVPEDILIQMTEPFE
jgi:putative ABC transport system substrate-binding protein